MTKKKQLYLRKTSHYTENTVYQYLEQDDFVPELVQRTRLIMRNIRENHPWNELSDLDFFKAAGLYRKDYSTKTEGFTMAALLLFGKDEAINSMLPGYKTEAVLRRQELDRYDDRETIRGNLIDAYDKLIAFIEKHLPDKFYMEGETRISLRNRLFREIVSNTLVHREYTNGTPASMIIYQDHVEFQNANKPHYFGQLKPGDFSSFPKNPNIINFFAQIGRVENLGTGIRNVYKYSKLYSDNDNVVFTEDDLFKVTIPLTSKNGGLNGGLNETQKILLETITNRAGIQAKDLAELLSMPIDTVDKVVAFLIKNQYIERRGSKKTGGYWLKN